MSEADVPTRVVVVTGAGSGIGRAICLAFGEMGETVLAVDINEASATATADLVGRAGGTGRAFHCDVAHVKDVQELERQISDKFGRVNVLCNNAGVFDGFSTLSATDDDLWERVLAVNLTGPFLLCRALIPLMLSAGGGSIINTASIAGLVAGTGGAAYTAAKHGLIGLTRQLAHEYGKRGIRVNAICPGPIATELSAPLRDDPSRSPLVSEGVARIPSGRWGEPEEVAALVRFLASDDASYVQGAVIAVDGGWTAI